MRSQVQDGFARRAWHNSSGVILSEEARSEYVVPKKQRAVAPAKLATAARTTIKTVRCWRLHPTGVAGRRDGLQCNACQHRRRH